MKKSILSLLFIIPFVLSAQVKSLDTIRINLLSNTTNRLILYSAEGAKQKYETYADSQTGHFILSLPKNSHIGMYRLVYNSKTMDYIDFLYTGTGFEINLDLEHPTKIPIFIHSPENTSYYKSLNNFGNIQAKLDSLQVSYFQEDKDLVKSITEQNYNKLFIEFTEKLNSFKNTTTNLLVKDLVLANIRILPKTPIKQPLKYLDFLKMHYFDSIDFDNPHLIYSSVLVDKVMDYIFYLTVAKDTTTQNELYKIAINDVLQKIDNQEVKLGFIKSLIQSFTKDENIVLTDYLFSHYYDKLPKSLQDSTYKKGIQKELTTAVGRIAPDFEISKNDSINLYGLKGYDYYVIVFWSSTCPHCLKEIPKLYTYIKDVKNIKIIAIGLETEDSKSQWKSETYYYPEFTHVLASGKWENPLPRSYNVFATPSYFILNSDKRIIDKPYEFIDLKEFFEKQNIEVK